MNEVNGIAEVEVRSDGLGFAGLYAQALGSMAPPYNCIVVGSVIAALSGHGIAAAFLLAGFAMMFYGITIVSLADNVTSTGGLYGMVGSTLGRRAALWFGGALVLNGLFSIPATVVSAAYLLQLIVGAWAPSNVFAQSWLLWVAILTPLAFLVSYLGADVSARVVLTIIGCGMIAIVFLDVTIMAHVGLNAVPWSTLYEPTQGGAGRSGMMLSVGVAVITLAGSESAIYLAGEARNPKRHIPWAVYGSIGAAALFYLLTSLAFSAALPSNSLADLWGKNGPEVISKLGTTYISKGFAIATLSLVAASAFAGVISFINYIARVMLAMAEDRYLPASFAVLDSRQSPWISITVLAVLTVASFAIGYCMLGDRPDGAITFFTWLYFGVTLFLISNYILICVSAVVHGKSKGNSGLRTYIAPFVTLGIMLLATKAELTPLPPPPFDVASWFAIGLLAFVVIYAEWVVRGRVVEAKIPRS
ncbi:APC family permease [Paraburkholderia agricolaris]|uniref:APC family permease n=1 Tax=Paraburkholderia agricolaris TaxID=2152888 RepID=A0ABW8ZYN9_9BURK